MSYFAVALARTADGWNAPEVDLDGLALCAQEGTRPADVITTVCERAGCLDELDTLRLRA